MNWLFQAAKTGRIKSIAQAIREFFRRNNRMPSVRERNTMGSILQDITQKSNVIEFPKDRITPFYKPRPGDVKKTDESPLGTLLSKQSKELEGIDAHVEEANSLVGQFTSRLLGDRIFQFFTIAKIWNCIM